MNVAFKFTGLALLMAQLTFSGSVAFFGQQAALASSPTVTLHQTAPSNQGDDPDMGGREGVPPNSVGSGTR
jgi:hypothetical protein